MHSLADVSGCLDSLTVTPPQEQLSYPQQSRYQLAESNSLFFSSSPLAGGCARHLPESRSRHGGEPAGQCVVALPTG
jgi:hypothetical protein